MHTVPSSSWPASRSSWPGLARPPTTSRGTSEVEGARAEPGHDDKGLGSAAAIGTDASGKLRKAATEFEAVAIGELLAPMFDTVDTAHGAFGGGDGEAAWRPMLVQAIGRQMAENGGLGLADSIYRALMRAQESGQEPTR